MRTKSSTSLMLAAAAIAVFAGATEVRADACAASNSALVTRSTGGQCVNALSDNEIFTLTYKITNQSVIDGGPNDGDFVNASIDAGNEIVSVLAQETAGVGGTELPGVLTFIPVCSAGSSMNEGLACNPMAPNCGTGNCGCESALPGVTCVADGNNKVNLLFAQDTPFGDGEQRDIATIRVQSTGTADGICGEYFARMDSTGDIVATDDVDCDSIVTAGAQGSANLHAPPCASDSDCGDTDCNVCADIGVDNHCEVANIGSSCGTDTDADDCVLPACVDEGGTGVCSQGEINEAEGASCDDDGIDCTEDVCDDGGACLHTVNDAFCDDQDACTEEFCSPSLDCVYDFICEGGAICRSPGFWATHSGYEKSGKSVNVGQLVIDEVGPIEVCGETIDSTSNPSSPYLAGLGLDSNLEGLCMKAKGVPQRRLYRHLVAAAFNCAVSGGDCDTVTAPFVDVSFSDCSDLCAGNPVVDGPTLNECASQFDCFNNGGQIINGECAFGTCPNEIETTYCDGDFGSCPDFMGNPQECVEFPGNCHDQLLCNEAINICPKSGPASSPGACREARGNSCTIDSCN